MSQLQNLQLLRSELYEIAHKHHATSISVFGSCARQEETPTSDVDLLVEFLPDATLFDHVHIHDEMEQLLKCKVDIVSKNGLHPYIKNTVLSEAISL